MIAATSSYLAVRSLTVPSRTIRFEFRASETVPSAATVTDLDLPGEGRRAACGRRSDPGRPPGRPCPPPAPGAPGPRSGRGRPGRAAPGGRGRRPACARGRPGWTSRWSGPAMATTGTPLGHVDGHAVRPVPADLGRRDEGQGLDPGRGRPGSTLMSGGWWTRPAALTMAASGVLGWAPVTVTTLASNSGVWSSPTPSATRATTPDHDADPPQPLAGCGCARPTPGAGGSAGRSGPRRSAAHRGPRRARDPGPVIARSSRRSRPSAPRW